MVNHLGSLWKSAKLWEFSSGLVLFYGTIWRTRCELTDQCVFLRSTMGVSWWNLKMFVQIYTYMNILSRMQTRTHSSRSGFEKVQNDFFCLLRHFWVWENTMVKLFFMNSIKIIGFPDFELGTFWWDQGAIASDHL